VLYFVNHCNRCVVLCEPLRNDARSSESWSIVLTRIRQLVVESYTQSLAVFEDHMRAERERRTDPNWSFCQYFLLQVDSFIVDVIDSSMYKSHLYQVMLHAFIGYLFYVKLQVELRMSVICMW